MALNPGGNGKNGGNVIVNVRFNFPSKRNSSCCTPTSFQVIVFRPSNLLFFITDASVLPSRPPSTSDVESSNVIVTSFMVVDRSSRLVNTGEICIPKNDTLA